MIRHYVDSRVRDIAPGVTQRTLGWSEKLLMSQVVAAKNTTFPTHSHPWEQIGYLATGRIVMHIEGEEDTELNPGDTWIVPANVPHGSMCLEDCIQIDAFSPPREDYKD